MKYIVAYDGGGTKTRINVIDLDGRILFDKITTGCNIISIGDVAFILVIRGLWKEALEVCNLQEEDILMVSLGLSGADLEEDYKHLYDVCKPIFGKVPYTIQNDAWIILRSGLKAPYGAVCICGTGTNSAAINKQGKRAILRAISYTLGTFGGGLDIARDALHYAFRADEQTYQNTQLTTTIPAFLGVKTMEEVLPLFYPKQRIDKQTYGEITGLVFDCAKEGDEVCKMILTNVAKHIALQTAGVIKQNNMQAEEVPVVIGGRVFEANCSLFIDMFFETIKKEVPDAYLVIPTFSPVIGAYLHGLDILGIEQTLEIENNIQKTGGAI